MINWLYAKFLALKRRIFIFMLGDFDPYPKRPDGYSYSVQKFLKHYLESTEMKCCWNSNFPGGTEAWQKKTRAILSSLLYLKKDLSLTILKKSKLQYTKNFKTFRYFVRFEEARDVPIDIVFPKTNDPKAVMICMQGSNSGAHLNLGKVLMPADVYKVSEGSALALQAAESGYLAVSYERLGFGERRFRGLGRLPDPNLINTSLHALNLGTTLLGETVREISALIKWVKKELTPNLPICLVGYSAAGTAALVAGAIDKNISGIAIGGCVGFVKETLMRRDTGGFNDIPGILNYFEQDALLALFAPRPCIVISGSKDHIWPYSGAKKVVNAATPIYADMHKQDFLKLIKADGPHTYYPKLMWPEIEKFF